ncbi:M56 family metallopeptidase [Albidovulum sp.]|jgi:hypothetical protein|uniref:M56 family metallopeptidase n=1 Tax=Albidovulum sp. TaxID=1872424 RepID=UPI00304BA6AC
MINASTLLDAYVDVNLLLVFVCVLWFAFSRALDLFGLSYAVTARLRMLRMVFLAVLLGPLFAGLVAGIGRAGHVQPAQQVNLTDFIVAQYLQGRFQMNASALEQLLNLRARLAEAAFSPAGQAVLVAAMLGAALCMAGLGWSVVKLRRVLAEAHRWRRIGRIDLRLSDTITVPFSTRGFRTRIVVLPSSMLERASDLKIALGHEFQHLRQGDVEWEIALRLIRPFFFWNPAFHIWKHQVEELRELSCDRQVLARRRYDVADYCDCLLRVCHDGLRRRRLLAVEVPVVALVRTENRLFGGRPAALLRRRMLSVIEGRAERHPRLAVAVLSGPALAVTLTAAVAIQKPGDWSQDRIMLSTIVNLERLQAVNGPVPMFGSPGF